MPNEYEFDAVRWLRSNAKLAAGQDNNAAAVNLTMCAAEVERLRAENEQLRRDVAAMLEREE